MKLSTSSQTIITAILATHIGCGTEQTLSGQSAVIDTAQGEEVESDDSEQSENLFYYLTSDGVLGSVSSTASGLESGDYSIREFEDISWLNGYDSNAKAVASDGFESNQFYLAFVNTSLSGSSIRIMQMGGEASGTEIAYLEDERFAPSSSVDLSARCDGSIRMKVDNLSYSIDIESGEVESLEADETYLSISNEIDERVWGCDVSETLRSINGGNSSIASDIQCAELAASSYDRLWSYHDGSIREINTSGDIARTAHEFDFVYDNIIELAPVAGFCI